MSTGVPERPSTSASGKNFGKVPPETFTYGLEHHHRDVRGGAARAAIFGVSDGLVSNASLILGVAGANAHVQIVRIAGIAGLLANALSMGAGEYVSMKAQSELLQRELDLERQEIINHPKAETLELTRIYESRGVETGIAEQMASSLMSDTETALQTHAREELGIDPESLGSPLQSSVSSLLATAIGAFVPLLPWLFLAKGPAIVGTIVLSLALAIGVGFALSSFTGRSAARSIVRQVVVCSLAGAVTFGVGALVGIAGV